jgi:hypothetical protein
MKYIVLLLLVFVGVKLQAQDTLQLGIENSLEYNFRLPRKIDYGNIKRYSVLHESLLFVGSYKNNMFFIGPQISNFYGFLYDPVDKLQNIGYGLNFGYEYDYPLSKENRSFILSTRISFSLYEAVIDEQSLGPNEEKQKRFTILENNIYVGLKKSFNNFYFHSGFGIGSTQGFFLMVESFMLPSTFGFGFEF